MNTPNERDLIDAVARLLRQKENELERDTLTGARLRAARLRAIEHARAPWRLEWLGNRALIGAAFAIVIAVTTWIAVPFGSTDSPDVVVANFDPTEDNVELYDDLEFYGWLAAQDDAS